MGQRGEIFSTRLFTDEGRKTYFFNVKENRYGDLYLNIAESRKTDRDFRRSSIVVFQENLDSFIIVLDRVVAGIQRRQSKVKQTLTLGKGRREYDLCLMTRGKPALRISEERRDETGSRRESIYVAVDFLDTFLDGFKKAVKFLTKE